MTYCAYTGESGRDPSVVPKGSRAAQPSNFWLEVHDALQAREHAISAQDVWNGCKPPCRKPMLISAQGEAIALRRVLLSESMPRHTYAVVGEAWQTPMYADGCRCRIAVPATLTTQCMNRVTCIDVIAADSSSLEQHQTRPLLQRRTLLGRRRLMADAPAASRLMRQSNQAQRILAAGRQNVTTCKPARWHERTEDTSTA